MLLKSYGTPSELTDEVVSLLKFLSYPGRTLFKYIHLCQDDFAHAKSQAHAQFHELFEEIHNIVR